MGENGSGKSTLVKILSRACIAPMPGRSTVGGEQVAAPLLAARGRRSRHRRRSSRRSSPPVSSPSSRTSGSASDGLLRRRIPKDETSARARETLGELLDIPRLDVAANTLPLSDRQATCIARALVRHPKVLILDEATSALDVATRERLFRVLERLRADGAGILFISHRMDEVEEIADRVTVLRSGRSVATLRRGQATPRELVALMTGRRGRARPRCAAPPRRPPPAPPSSAPPASACTRSAQPIDVEIRAGELVGVAGLEGHGQDQFLRALPARGRSRARSSARSAVRSAKCARRATRWRAGSPTSRAIARQSIFESRSILENFQVATVKADRRRRARAPRAGGAALRALRRDAEDRRRPSDEPDHLAQRRQPAEGRHRALARDGPEDPRSSTIRRAGWTRAPSATSTRSDRRRRGDRGRDGLERAHRADRAHGPRARVPRGPAVPRDPRARSSRATPSFPRSSARRRMRDVEHEEVGGDA